MRKFYSIPIFLLVAGFARGQEVNFSRVQDMTMWYNQSLKTDKQDNLVLDYRSVSYGGQIAYNSVAAMFDMPLLSKDGKNRPHSGYFSMSAGAASDKSNAGILNNTLGMLGLSYAVPISQHETYLAIGFQAEYYQSNFNVAGIAGAFGDQFNAYGLMEGQPSADRLAAGWSYGHFNANVGASVFSNGKYDKWYLGVSAQQVNQPYSYEIKSDSTRMKADYGVQGGYKFTTATDDEMAFCMSMSWQGPAYRHYFDLAYTKAVPDLVGGGSVGLGLGYRYNDAIIPHLDLKYQKMSMAICYDVNISTISASGIARNGVELALRMDF